MGIYKGTKEEIVEASKDLKATIKWLYSNSKKVKKFTERDIFEEYDTLQKQIKELDKRITKISITLSETMKQAAASIERIDILYLAISALIKRLKRFEESEADKITSSAAHLLGFSTPNIRLNR